MLEEGSARAAGAGARVEIVPGARLTDQAQAEGFGSLAEKLRAAIRPSRKF